jgi:tetratricopeptide (TPR) repeat protein
MRRAEIAWRRIQVGEMAELKAVCDPDRADEMHAMCRLIAREDGHCEGRLRSIALFYQSVQQMSWPDDRVGEQADLLARLSYLAWLHANRWSSFDEAETWERIAVDQTLRHEMVRGFLGIPARSRSEDLNRRFLSDPAVLLAACARLRSMVETSPLKSVEEAILVYGWLDTNRQVFEPGQEFELRLAELAWIAAVGNKHCGRYRESQAWLDRLEHNCDGIAGAERLRARAGYVRLAVLHELRCYQEVIASLAELKERFARLGMRLSFAKCCLLEAITLKEIGRDAEARVAFDALSRDPAIQGERSLQGMVFTGIAELEGRLGLFEAAHSNILKAIQMLKESGTPLAVAHLHAVEGELLRDQGQLDRAVDSYRAAVVVYSAGEFPSHAAYLRVVLAETLMAAGRENEAISEIVAALPVIDGEHLVREGIAAMALLRESVRRKKTDPRALRELREQLERMQRGGVP